MNPDPKTLTPAERDAMERATRELDAELRREIAQAQERRYGRMDRAALREQRAVLAKAAKFKSQ